jgi:hypothetical protein
MATNNGTNNFSTANLIVDPTAGNGAYTTITLAMAAASAGKVIFVKAGTYTENLVLTPGVSIVGYTPGTPSQGTNAAPVIIVGNHTLASGDFNFSNVQLKPNAGVIFTASAGALGTFTGCKLVNTGGNGVAFVIGAAGLAHFWDCTFLDSAGSNNQFFALTAAGFVNIFNSSIFSSGSTANTFAGGSGCLIVNSYSTTANFTTSDTAGFIAYNSTLGNNALTTGLTIGGTGLNIIQGCSIGTTSGSSISVGTGATLTINNSTITSSNTNAITGAGTIKYQGLSFAGTSSTINTTTQSVAGTLQGSKTTAPTAGFLGEQIRSTVAFASAVTSTTTTVTNVTSISLTPGVWDVSGIVMYTGMTTSTGQSISVNTTSATIGTVGDNAIRTGFTSTTAQDFGSSIHSWRLTITVTTTVYLVGSAIYSAGTGKLYGRISATRVG